MRIAGPGSSAAWCCWADSDFFHACGLPFSPRVLPPTPPHRPVFTKLLLRTSRLNSVPRARKKPVSPKRHMTVLEPLLEEEIELEQKLPDLAPCSAILDWHKFYQMPFLANQRLEELDF